MLGNMYNHLPPILGWRAQLVMRVAKMAAYAPAFVAALLLVHEATQLGERFALPKQSIFPLGFGVPSFAAVLAIAVERWIRTRVTKVQVIECHGRLCGACGHRLTGMAARGNCPECGIRYCIDDLRSYWRRWIRSSESGFHSWFIRCGAALSISIVFMFFLLSGPLFKSLIFALSTSLWLIVVWWLVGMKKQFKETTELATIVTRGKWLLCPTCKSDLHRLTSTGACPSCGTFSKETGLEQYWKRNRPPHWQMDVIKPGAIDEQAVVKG